MEPWMIAIALVAAFGALLRYVFFLPGRRFSIWLNKKLPDGRLKRLLLKPVASEGAYPTWPKLPPHDDQSPR